MGPNQQGKAPAIIMSQYTNKKLVVGIFIDGDFIPSYSGAKNRMHYLSRYLQKSGIKVIIFHGYRGWIDPKLISEEPFKTYIIPIHRYHGDLRFVSNLVKKESVRIIQFCDLESTISQGVTLSQNTGAYLVAELHYIVSSLARNLGTPLKRIQTIRELEIFVGKITDHVICLSTDDRPKLQKKMLLPANRISVIPSGVDLEEIKCTRPNFKTKTVLFLGNLYFEPNADAVRIIHHYLYPLLSRRGFKILIVGDCPIELKRRFQAINFVFTGPVSNLNDVFCKTTVALAPIREGTGLRIKILNYLAAGLPVIATSEAVRGISNTKSIIIEDNFRRYPKIILDLVDNRSYTLRLGESGRKLVEHNFDWTMIARQTIKTYKDIIARKFKEKSHFAGLVSSLNIGKPDWLEEFERKERFRELKSKNLNNFSYGVINRGKIKIIKL